jgi:hypothetical protein
MSDTLMTLVTLHETLAFDPGSGRLVSLRPAAAPAQEFMDSAADHPVFALQYLDDAGGHRRLDSRDAGSCDASLREDGDVRTLVLRYTRVGGRDVEVALTVRAARGQPFSRWGLTLRNGAGLAVADVQFPFVVCRYGLGGAPGTETIVLPHDYGRLVHAPRPQSLGPDAAAAWQFTGRNGGWSHYPGGQFAQFIAYHNDRAGLYLATEDAGGRIKRFQCLHREPGMRMGVSHAGDWPAQGERTLEYDTVLGSFTGDWHDAAALYREWSMHQSWAVPIHRRADVPAWLLDSPVHVAIRPQGILDDGPVLPNAAFLPYEKCIPLLERIAARVASPLVAVLMGWERAGSWVYPDCFPPVGGEESLSRFARACREKGWRVGSFCNGTRWAMAHHWNDYDGRPFYDAHRGDACVCREADGRPWQDVWDAGWRPSRLQCAAAPLTGEIAEDFVSRLLGWGLESIQFFDQNCGAAAYPCFSPAHGHAPMPGSWMPRAMEGIMGRFRAAAARAGEREVVHSVEMSCNDFALPLFQQADCRLQPPGHAVAWGDIIPLFPFLYHECIVIHGMMSLGPEPYHAETANAANGVMGEIPGGVLTGSGDLLDKDTFAWAPWEPRVGNPARGLAMIRAVTALRRGPGKPFLVLGRMMKPARVEGIPVIKWTFDGKPHALPALFHAAWRSPEGRHGVAIANWTGTARRARVSDPRLGDRVTVHASGRVLTRRTGRARGGRLSVRVPPLGIVILEGGPS